MSTVSSFHSEIIAYISLNWLNDPDKKNKSTSHSVDFMISFNVGNVNFSAPCRLLHNGNPFAEATLPQAHRVCGRRDQNLRKLPLLQPQRHALLSMCRGA